MKYKYFIAFGCIAVLYGCPLQEDIINLDNRLARVEKRFSEFDQQKLEMDKKGLEIEARVEEFSGFQEEKNQNLRIQAAEIRNLVEKTREEIQLLNGKIEKTAYMLKKKTSTLDDPVQRKEKEERLKKIESLAKDESDRISRIEQYLNFESTKKSNSAAKKVNLPELQLTENEMYLDAKKAFDENDREAARKGFESFLKKFPKSENADNAQFWIGETYYREEWHEKAILEYQKVIEKYPKGNKVQASLLKQGFSFNNLGDKANARLILKELIKKYPASSEAKIAKQKLSSLK